MIQPAAFLCDGSWTPPPGVVKQGPGFELPFPFQTTPGIPGRPGERVFSRFLPHCPLLIFLGEMGVYFHMPDLSSNLFPSEVFGIPVQPSLPYDTTQRKATKARPKRLHVPFELWPTFGRFGVCTRTLGFGGPCCGRRRSRPNRGSCGLWAQDEIHSILMRGHDPLRVRAEF